MSPVFYVNLYSNKSVAQLPFNTHRNYCGCGACSDEKEREVCGGVSVCRLAHVSESLGDFFYPNIGVIRLLLIRKS